MKSTETLFGKQRRAAAARGIVWEFTFPMWVSWWQRSLGLDWQSKRGCKRGQYVMARHGDRGPYARWNVQCVLAEENCKARKVNGTTARGVSQGLTNLTENQVRRIYLAPGSLRSVARQFNVSRHIVARIKERTCWGHVTAHLGQIDHSYRNNVLKPKEVRAIFKATGSMYSIAKRFGKPYATIWFIKKRKTWRKVTDNL